MATIRTARKDESDVCVDVYRQAWRGMGFVPQDLHTPAEDRRWMRDVFARQLVLVAETNTDADDQDPSAMGEIVGFLTMGDGTIHNLYIQPGHQGRGLGHALIQTAKTSSAGELQLWVFEPNKGAIRFYQRHGFTTLRKTDGKGNEEKVPDRLMIWQGDGSEGA